MEISEKVAYLKGLAEGLALDTDTKEGKLIADGIQTVLHVAQLVLQIHELLSHVVQHVDDG